jgi:MFS family permease
MTNEKPRNLWRSTAAVLLGFIAVAALSLGTDQILHVLHVYPPWNQPMYDPGLNLLALAYRCVFTVVGGYLTARLAPRNPMRHVLVLAIIGFIFGLAGVIVAITVANLGPIWYPIALVITSVPCVWLGGILHRAKNDRA